ncbi:MAG: hypothetical protein U0Q22_00850 [Acidimicrobiales bacterium]
MLVVFAWPRFWAWWGGYETLGDAAVISLRATDLPTSGFPMVGMPSSIGAWSTVAYPFHPGPAVFWQMAPTAHLLGGGPGALTGSFLLVGFFGWWMIRTACRRFGPVAAPAAAAACILTAGMWPSTNPLLGTVPALATCFAAWSVLDDDRAAWPWLAAAASFAVQADLAFLFPSLALVCVAAVHQLRRRRHTDESTSVEEPSPSARVHVRRTLVVLGVFWVLPIVEAIRNDGGNVRELVKAATAGIPVKGIGSALPAVAVMLVPALLTGPIIVRSWRGARRGRRAMLVTALTAGVGTAVSQAMVPVGNAPSLTLLPVVITLIFTVFTVATLTADHVIGSRERRPLLLRRAAWGGFVVMVLGVAPTITGSSFAEEWYPAVRPLTDAIVSLPGTSYRLQPLSGALGTRFSLGLAEATNRRGVNLRVDSGLERYLGPRHATTGRESQALYVAFESSTQPVRGARLVGRWTDPGFDRRARAEIDRLVAAAVRRSRPVWASGANEFAVGTTVAAGGTGRARLDDDALFDLGQRLVQGTDQIRDLPDAVIAQLVADDMLELPGSAERLRDRLVRSRQAGVVSVWVADDQPPGRT